MRARRNGLFRIDRPATLCRADSRPFAYSVGKLAWTGIRWKVGAEIGYHWPFQDPGELGAVMYIIEGKSFKDIFTEEYLARECPAACGGR